MRNRRRNRTAAMVSACLAVSTAGPSAQPARSAEPNKGDATARKADKPEQRKPKVGHRVGNLAPDFEAKTLDGKQFKLSEQRGKIVLIDFWATWCGPCVMEIPRLKNAWKQFKDRDDFLIVGFSVDHEKSALKRLVKQRGITWPQIFGGRDADDVARAYGVFGIPSTFLIGTDGVILATELHGDQIAKQVGKHLSAKDGKPIIVTGTAVGDRAPEFEATTLDENKLKLSDLRGKFVFLDFWASWSDICANQIEHQVKAWNELKNKKRIQFVGISYDGADDGSGAKNDGHVKDRLKRFVNEKKLDWPQVYAEENGGFKLADTFAVDGIPTTFLIDPEGVIVAVDLRGPNLSKDLARAIEKAEADMKKRATALLAGGAKNTGNAGKNAAANKDVSSTKPAASSK